MPCTQKLRVRDFFMTNFNATISEDTTKLSIKNRGYNYGDALFETIKVLSGKVLFWEDHYFRLMASMRIMRMEIPMHYTMEYLEDQIHNTLKANGIHNTSARVKLTVYRNEGGLYLPENNNVSFIITAKKQKKTFTRLVNLFMKLTCLKITICHLVYYRH